MSAVDAAQFGFEIGLNSFGDVPNVNGQPLSDAETVRLLVDEARLAEKVGLDVLSTNDPVRLYNEFSTLDALSNGRAQMVVGAHPRPSRSRSSATTSPTPSSSSRRSWTSSLSCSGTNRSPGLAPCARRS